MTATLTALLVDAIAGDSIHIPPTANVAYYLTGNGIAWTAAELERFKAARVPILQSWTPDTAMWLRAAVLDVEAGALTLEQAKAIASFRHVRKLQTTIYISASGLAAARRALAGIPGVTFFVANWNLTRAEAEALIAGDIVAIQYASPDGGANTSATLPGSKLTIKQANVDMSVASAAWLARFTPTVPAKPVAKKRRKPHPKTTAATIGAAAITAATAFAKTKGIHLTGAESTILTATGAFLTATITPIRKS